MRQRWRRHRMGRREVLCPLIAARHHLFLSKHLYFVLYHTILYTIYSCKTLPLPLQQTPTRALFTTILWEHKQNVNNWLLFCATLGFVAHHNHRSPNEQRPRPQVQFVAPQHWGGTKCKWGNENVCKKAKNPSSFKEKSHVCFINIQYEALPPFPRWKTCPLKHKEEVLQMKWKKVTLGTMRVKGGHKSRA